MHTLTITPEKLAEFGQNLQDTGKDRRNDGGAVRDLAEAGVQDAEAALAIVDAVLGHGFSDAFMLGVSYTLRNVQEA